MTVYGTLSPSQVCPIPKADVGLGTSRWIAKAKARGKVTDEIGILRTNERKKILDVGGGPGRYTIELLKHGYQVTLFDLSPENVALAKTKIAELNLKADALLVGDARDLSVLCDGRFDGARPLYHLTNSKERSAFLEAARILLHTDGVLIAAYLNAWEIAQTLLTDAPQWFADARKVDYLLAGEELAGARTCSGFTECHWSTPDDARTEIAEAGFPMLEVAGAEGFAGGVRNEVAVNARDNPALFEQ